MIAPSAEFSLGYQVATINLNNGESHTGIISKDTEAELALKVGQEDFITIAKADIADIESIPSSMPDMSSILNKSQIRDIVAFLESLK